MTLTPEQTVLAFFDHLDERRYGELLSLTALRHDDGEPHTGPVTIQGPFRMSVVNTRLQRRGGAWCVVEQSIVTEFEFAA